jgi:sterol 14-demethylase
MTLASDLLAQIPEVSTALDDRSPEVPEIIRGTGHLPEMRVDPVGSPGYGRSAAGWAGSGSRTKTSCW